MQLDFNYTCPKIDEAIKDSYSLIEDVLKDLGDEHNLPEDSN